jgi:transposase
LPEKYSRSPESVALETVGRIDALLEIERAINGLGADQRLVARQTQGAPFVAELEAWMRQGRTKLSRRAEVARAMDDMLERNVVCFGEAPG